jgi:hypothetical protein
MALSQSAYRTRREMLLFGSPEFVADARAVIKSDQGKLDAIGKALSERSGFADAAVVFATVRDTLTDETTAFQVANFIVNMDRLFRSSADGTVAAFIAFVCERVRQDNKPVKLSGRGSDHRLSETEVEELCKRLPALIKGYPALGRQWKAEKLTQRTGSPLEDISLTCDLRPVLDEEREHVEGAFPVTTLRVVVAGPDGFSSVTEAHLTEGELRDLRMKADYALRKLSALKSLLAEKGIDRPIIEREGEQT